MEWYKIWLHTLESCPLHCLPTVLSFFFKFYLFIYLFIYLWLCWVFISVRGLSLVAASGGHSSSRCAGLSLSRPLLLRSTGFRCAGSVVVVHGPSRSAACGIFPDRARTRVPCIGRQILNHCAPREAPTVLSWSYFFLCCPCPSLDYTPREEIYPGRKLWFVSLRVHRAQTTAVPYDIFISLCTHLRTGLCKNLSVSIVVFRLTCHISSMNLLGIWGILLFSSPFSVP